MSVTKGHNSVFKFILSDTEFVVNTMHIFFG